MVGKAVIAGWLAPTVILAGSWAQTVPTIPPPLPMPAQSLITPFDSLAPANAASTRSAGAQPLLEFRDSDIKFSLQSLMDILRDHRHEGWVLAAYPDPNTGRPLIGAGFSLDVAETEHLQRDPLNPHPFLEPSSAQLWEAAGLAPERLQQILEEYQRHREAWSAKQYRRKILHKTLSPQLTEEEAMRLLRISAVQAVYNAKAYCRNFDQLTASQQMALAQLVFQMGTNLEEFAQFLGALNDANNERELAQLEGYLQTGVEHWQTVQNTLMDSQWARRYSVRAASVIAMFDPAYDAQPELAEQRVAAVLHPAVEHHRRPRTAATLRRASYSRHTAGRHSKKTNRAQVNRS